MGANELKGKICEKIKNAKTIIGNEPIELKDIFADLKNNGDIPPDLFSSLINMNTN